MEPVNLMIKKSRLRWSRHVERKDDNDWGKRCRGMLKGLDRERTTEKDPEGDMESLGLSQKV